MRLKSLRLFEFRNFERLSLTLFEGVNFFTGENGQGKTNLLEAVYVLARGGSFRPAATDHFLRQSGDGVAAKARISGRFARDQLEDMVEVNFADGRRTAELNGKRAGAVDLARVAPVVLFSPESLAAIKEGPDQRRALADDLVITQAPRQAKLLQEHAKCLRARNRLLRSLSRGEGHTESLELTLKSLDAIYFLLCTHLTDARLQALRETRADFGQAMAFISEVNPGDISVDYLISDCSAIEWTEAMVFDALRKRHAELARHEVAAGVSLIGPHKHDIKFLFKGVDSRFYCSQGQQRALILSFKIAQIVYHHRVHQTYPILLLDDVLSELDAKKRIGLMKFLNGISAQILMTSTEPEWPKEFKQDGDGVSSLERNAIFSVANGEVEQLML